MPLLLGHSARRLGIPAVFGESTGGLLLGPTILSRVAPEIHHLLFPATRTVAAGRTAFARVSMLIFIVTVGLDVGADFRRTGRQVLAAGSGLDARGILDTGMAAAAHDAELIDLRLFVACVLMFVITTMAAGPALRLILGRSPAAEPAAG